MYKLLFVFFIFLSSIVSAEDAITQYLTSENDTLALVEGVVNTYNGKLVQIDKDIEIQGFDPLEVTRYYDGGHHFVSDYGYGVGLAFPLTLTYETNLQTKNMWVELRGGSQIPFNVDKSKKKFFGKIDSEFLRTDYTNCCAGLLRGETDISAMSVYGDIKTFIVDLGNGLKRHYQYFICTMNQNYEEIKDIFNFVELLMCNGNQSVQNAIATGFLEELLNKDPDEIQFIKFTQYLGKETIGYLKAWNEFNGTHTEGL